MSFFKIFTKKLHPHAHILSKIRLFSKKYTVLKPILCQNKRPVLSKTLCSYVTFSHIFHEKPSAVKPIFGQKNVNSVKTLYPYFIKICPFSKNHTLFSYPYFVKKTSILTKKHCSHITFSNFDMKNLLLLYPYLVKHVNSVRITPSYGPKI